MLQVMTYNTLFGGFDGEDNRRFDLQAHIILEADPDILLVQEWKGFLADGQRRRFSAERRLGRRALVAQAPNTGQNTAILVKPEVEIIRFEEDSAHFHHAAAIAQLRVPGHSEPITVASVHLCPNSPEVRLREAAYLAALADERAHVLIGGDFNSVSPHDPEPPLAELPPRFRFRYADETGRADHRTLAALERAGFVDVGHVLDSEATRTVPGASFSGTEFVPFRCDYLLATPLLAAKASGYRVIDDAQAGAASDHYPLVCAFS